MGERVGHQALSAWVVSAVAAVLGVGGLERIGFVQAFVPVSIALTATALGTLLPTLREHNMLAGVFGRVIFAAGAVGELLPILATSVFLRVSSGVMLRDNAAALVGAGVLSVANFPLIASWLHNRRARK